MMQNAYYAHHLNYMKKDLYRLDSFENNTFRIIKHLTEEEFVNAKQSVKIISEYNQHFLIYIYFQLNLIEFDNLCKSLSNLPVVQVDIRYLQSKHLHINVNRIVFNLLSSFKFFLDGSESYVKRKFGNASSEAKQFTYTTNDVFDKSFAYRFLYKLRNYSQHLGFPIHLTPFQAVKNRNSPESMVGDVKMIVDREKLIQEKDLLGRIVYNDLASLTDDIDVKPLIFELAKDVLAMEQLIFRLHSATLENSIAYIDSLAGGFKTGSNQLVIMCEMEEDAEQYRLKYLNLPFDDISEIKRFSDWSH
jgi:hypothetical protein